MALFDWRRKAGMWEPQELHCHNCNQYVRFDMDLSQDGNHVLKCPNCGHEHCRVVKDGRITGIRWDSRNGPRVQAHSISYGLTSTTSSTSATFYFGAWTSSVAYQTSGTS